jgi:hypothetical protein
LDLPQALEVIQTALDPSQLLSLNCLFMVTSLIGFFTVERARTKNVGILKRLIKEKDPILDHIAWPDLETGRLIFPLTIFHPRISYLMYLS